MSSSLVTRTLASRWYDRSQLQSIATREGFGTGLVDSAKHNDQIVAICADLTESLRMNYFAEQFPNRFFQVGVAEQNLVTVASGLAAMGLIPFAGSFAAFSPGRSWEQIRTTICYNDQPVKIIGGHTGLSVGPDGATHQVLEDIALMRVLPNMQVVVPADSLQTYQATQAIATTDQPSYLRLTREKTPVFTTARTPFRIGQANTYKTGRQATIVGCGPVLYEALAAAHQLKNEFDIEVIDMHTIKPLDTRTLLRSARKTGVVITIEEHQVAGGLGSAVAEALAAAVPTRVIALGIQDRFGESGEAAELWDAYGLSTARLITQLRRLQRRYVSSTR